ncbi:IS66 family insertion sequence element accessory protein TnpB [Pseudomonas sp. NPDC089918]
MEIRAGTDTSLTRVVAVFGAAKPHFAYLLAYRPQQSHESTGA